jgi:hypothetical protein
MCDMENNEEIWRAAYNAALTGYLGSGHNDIQDVARAAEHHADAALKIHNAKWHPQSAPAASPRPTS